MSKEMEEKTAEKMPNTALAMVGVLSIIAILSGGALGLTDYATSERIAANRLERQLSAIRQVLPDFANDPYEERWVNPGNSGTVFPGLDESGELFGAAVQAGVRSGYAGEITGIVGFDIQSRVIGLVVLQHSETPGLGARIIETDFRDQFTGVQPLQQTVEVRQDGGEIDAITAATVSSRAVAEIVNTAAAIFKEYQEAEHE
ncbi:RnfABCDGE type electron transport complex subunit G [Spirochaeta dissipatitropha]